MTRDRLTGALMVVVGVSLIATLEGISKILMQSLAPTQVFAGRFIVHLLLLSPFIIWTYRCRLWRDFNPRIQIFRGACLAVSVFLFVLALSQMPLARAIALVAVSPFVVALLSFIMLGERVRMLNIIFIGGGFGGVLLIARPDIGLDWHNLIAVLSGVCYALFIIFSRKISAAVPGMVSSLYVAIAAVVMVLPFLLLTEIKSLSAEDIQLFILAGGMSAGAHYFMARAFTFAEASFLSLFVYWELAAAIIVGFLFHGDIPDIRDWGGICIITVCGIMMILVGRRLN